MWVCRVGRVWVGTPVLGVVVKSSKTLVAVAVAAVVDVEIGTTEAARASSPHSKKW